MLQYMASSVQKYIMLWVVLGIYSSQQMLVELNDSQFESLYFPNYKFFKILWIEATQMYHMIDVSGVLTKLKKYIYIGFEPKWPDLVILIWHKKLSIVSYSIWLFSVKSLKTYLTSSSEQMLSHTWGRKFFTMLKCSSQNTFWVAVHKQEPVLEGENEIGQCNHTSFRPGSFSPQALPIICFLIYHQLMKTPSQ